MNEAKVKARIRRTAGPTGIASLPLALCLAVVTMLMASTLQQLGTVRTLQRRSEQRLQVDALVAAAEALLASRLHENPAYPGETVRLPSAVIRIAKKATSGKKSSRSFSFHVRVLGEGNSHMVAERFGSLTYPLSNERGDL